MSNTNPFALVSNTSGWTDEHGNWHSFMKAPRDFMFENHGSLVILYAQTDAARLWVAKHIPDDAQTWGKNGTVIEPRYVQPILDGILNDGLTLE